MLKKIYSRVSHILKKQENTQLEEETPAPENTQLKKETPAPDLNFIKNYSSYTTDQRSFVDNHTKKAVSKIPENSPSFLVAAAINHYIHSYFENKEWAGGASAFEVLTTRHANCGGKVLAMAEMLYSYGISSRFAYAIGGEPAHSMLEVTLEDDKCGLFDPFIGAVYLDKETKDPISIFTIKERMRAAKASTFFAKVARNDDGSVQPMTSFDDAYSLTPPEELYLIYPERMEKYKTLGVQNSGCLDVIDIVLKPGQLIGHSSFQPKEGDPKPWLKLGTHVYSNAGKEEHLSWAYMLGYVGEGYRVQHMYYLQNLNKDKSYTLKLYLVTGYKSPWEHWLKGNPPKITLKQVTPCGESFYYSVTSRTVDYNNFIPEVVSLTFKATQEEMCFLGHAAGNILLCGIELEEGI